jgi:hypothetical protein
VNLLFFLFLVWFYIGTAVELLLLFVAVPPDGPAVPCRDPSAFRHPVARGFGFI